MAHEITDLSTSTFDETVSGADKPVVVDFWAEWCGPCKKIAPILTEIAGERSELSVTKLNVDDNPDIAMKFNVMVPYENRMTMHESMLNLVGESRNLREHFKNEVERANSQMELL